LSGTIPEWIHKLSQLTYLILTENNFTGTIPASLSKLEFLMCLQFDSNNIAGTFPSSLSNLRELRILRLGQNRIFGTLPSGLENLTQLTVFDAGGNQFVGTIPPSFAQLQMLTQLNLTSNQLSGSIPNCLRHLTNLNLLALSRNDFVGNFELLDATFFPALVDVSENQLGPSLSPFLYGLGKNATKFYASLDIRSQKSQMSFLCPFPDNFPETVLFLRSPCIQPWRTYGIYVGYAAAVMVPLALICYYFRSSISAFHERFKFAIYLVQWVGVAAGLFLDVLNMNSIIRELLVVSNNCESINFYAFFSSFFSPHFGFYAEFYFRPSDLAPPSTTFSSWLHEYFLVQTRLTMASPSTILNIEGFKSICEMMAECRLDLATLTCWQQFPDLALTGGAAFKHFFVLTIMVGAIRGGVESCRIFIVALSLLRGSIVGGSGGAEIVRSSLSSPLLLLTERTRVDFRQRILDHRPTHRDFLLRIIHAGVLSSIPLLAVNVYFVSMVSQTGLSATNWISLILGLLSVSTMLLQSVLSWRSRNENVFSLSSSEDEVFKEESNSYISDSGSRDYVEIEDYYSHVHTLGHVHDHGFEVEKSNSL
jgi:hypothetical protein